MGGVVYVISNLRNGKCYIGSTVDYRQRLGIHLSSLHRGVHHSLYLQRAWDKYGESNFWFGVLEYTTENPREAEQFYLDLVRPEYNICMSAAASRLGIPHTAATKAKISRTKIERGSHQGERGGFSKLTTRKVIEIRERLIDGERSYKLAVEYKVSGTCIRDIKTGRTWRSVPQLLDEVLALPDARMYGVPPRRKANVIPVR